VNRALLGVAVALVVSTLGVSYWAFFIRREHKTEEARPTIPETLVVMTQSGHVEIAGPDGTWRPAQPGTALSARDRIRTDDDGEAQLRAGDGSTVKLLPATEARVAELRRELKRLHLGTGMVEAEVADSADHVFELELDDDGGVARTRGGSFTAASNGAGTAAVASRRGEVVLSARGREVVLRTGQWARIKPGEAPEQPAPIPSSLFLKVAWPEKALRAHKVEVEGRTTPGARVSVEGKWVQVDSDGRYRRTMSLPDGAHQLRVHAIDVAGHSADESSPRIVVDTKTDFSVQPPKWK
jgi:hypothetical protein